MLSDRLRPGTYGYVDYKKRKLALFSLVLAFFIAALITAGLLIFGTVKNLLMVPALLCVIPFANFFANLAALIRIHSAGADQYSMVRNFEEPGMLLSDLVVVDGDGKRHFFAFAIIHASGIAAYAPAKLKERFRPEAHITDLLKKRGVTTSFKIYEDFDSFLKAVNGLKPCADEKRAELIKETLILTCM